VLAASAESLSTSFAENKRRLGWPVSTGFVSQKFGPNPHPVMKHIMVPNDGVDIQTNRDAEVKAVFDGVVKMIASLPGPGNNKAVIVQHGEYFTVYSRLKEVAVKQGQALRLNDAVGLVYTDGNGVSALQFQIWHNQEKLNPETWLQRK
jgi:murein DD-endopeptidase MepM/ murein hydrolase activator NlpD